jgi:hypothetical protein
MSIGVDKQPFRGVFYAFIQGLSSRMRKGASA